MTRLLIIGAGQLGAALARLAPQDPHWGAASVRLLDRAALDLADGQAIVGLLEALRPDMVINAAAYNRVDDAEAAPEQAFVANAIGPGRLARAATGIGARLVHVSTDYVFSGIDTGDAPRPYREHDLPDPCSVYGASKLAGEHLVGAYAPGALIVRTSGVYGWRPPGGKTSFVEAILRQAAVGTPLQVVADQWVSPTYAADLARAILALARLDVRGIVHATNDGSCSWFEFARAILEDARLAVPISPVPSRERPTAARRPSYSVLDNGRLRALGIAMPHWRDALARYLRERNATPVGPAAGRA